MSSRYINVEIDLDDIRDDDLIEYVRSNWNPDEIFDQEELLEVIGKDESTLELAEILEKIPGLWKHDFLDQVKKLAESYKPEL